MFTVHPFITDRVLWTVKVKLSLCFNWAPRHEGILREWRYSSTHSLTSALDEGEWSASRPGRFTPRESATGTHWIGGWIGSRALLDAVVKRKIPSTRRESNHRAQIVQPVAQRYTNWAVTKVIVKLSLCLTKYHTMKTYGELVGWPHVFLTSALEGGERSASHPGRFIPGVRAPGTHWIESWLWIDQYEKYCFRHPSGSPIRGQRQVKCFHQLWSPKGDKAADL
jgi:hypothetical protein